MITLLTLAVTTISVSIGHITMTEYLKRWEETIVNLVTPWWTPLLKWGIMGAKYSSLLYWFLAKRFSDRV